MQRLRALSDLITPYAIRVAATLRLADLIDEGAGSAAELAQRCGADPAALERLLRHLVAKGVFAQPEPGEYALTELSRPLLTDPSGGGMRHWLDMDGGLGRSDMALSGMLQVARTGRPVYEDMFGRTFWADLEADPERGRAFDALMAAQVSLVADEVTTAYDWSGVRGVVDVGGGTGTLLAALLAKHPALRGTLVDLPSVVETGRRDLEAAGLADRCDFSSASFFATLPPGGDVYVLSRVLHDWDDEDARTILRRCAEAAETAGPSGRVLVIEQLVADQGNSPMTTAMDLRMLSVIGGRERSLDEYRALAAGAGLSLRGTIPTESGRSILEFAR
ncbi:methyltransferase [Actinomadura sp. GC306]|uniref:methyltransferase n=1 Tax=Actinomadura sp. GC306 TaxID=2530367 RepID=UPI00104D393F|nr:methyltransferase [Actinomadura sp. GC306]TDC72052.1 methyltransferase [Actinomadura sp. GC306]